MHNDIKRILYSEDQIKQKVAAMATQIEADFKGKELVTVGCCAVL